MKLRAEQLARHLRDSPCRLHVLCGDDPLLLRDSVDEVRAAARQAGYHERQTHQIDRGFDWDRLLADSQALSLFADRRLLELRFSGKPDASASAALISLADRPPEDSWLLITLPKLDAAAQKSKWLTALDQQGAVLTLFPVEAHELPAWLRQRGSQQGLQLTPDALQLLADRCEGNLLAGAQALDKLALLAGGTAVDIELVASVIGDSTRYSVFDLADAVLQGESTRSARLLLGLESEGVAESVVLWALQKDLRGLIQVAEQAALSGQRQANASLLGQAGFWSRRQGPAQQALARLPLRRLHQLHALALAIDKAIKGQSEERAWDVLYRLGMAMAGRPLLSD